jgi:threonine efflux protein
MMYFYLLLSLLAIDMLAAMSPGPNFVLVVRTSIQRPRQHAAAVVMGLASANLIWCAAVVFGLATLFNIAPWLYAILKALGGIYLIYLGLNLWRSKSTTAQLDTSPQKASLAPFIRGLLTNLSNPKSVVYFGSIFALFMRPGMPAWVKIASVCIVLFDTLLWYGTVALMFSNRAVRQFYARIQRPINRITSCVMIGFGVKLILSPKNAS